ncbi:MAG: 50S ribosomal protein L22 [Bdellovibrionaceae bacterium]|nr:50S ribosomal protein L22 [Pseudobdellovibrionaceae bacterium]
MESKASLRFARVGAQKARLVADVIRGKKADNAIKLLTFMNSKSSDLFKKLVESAVANADFKKTMDVDKLYVKTVFVDQGPSLKRFRPRAQGRAFGVKKKTSHLNVVLEER